jgi:hypothetical protein
MLALMLTVICTALIAQRRGDFDPQRPADRQTEEMKEILNLNDAQYASVKNINDKYAEKAQGLRKEAVGERRELREKFEALRNERQIEIKAVLTKDQQSRWEQHRELKKKERRESIEQRHVDRQKQMKAELQLSEEQESKLATLQKEHKAAIKAVWENSTLTQEVRTAQVKNLREKHDTDVKALLTPEQYEKWKSGKQHRKGLHRKHHFDKR